LTWRCGKGTLKEWFRAVIFMAVILGESTDAKAGEQTGVLHRMSCAVVRYYVALHRAPAAEPAR
jgi:hypothetical protein